MIEVENNAQAILPRRFEQSLTRITTGELNDQWRAFYVNEQQDINFDYKVIMNITDVQVSPSIVSEKEYVNRKEIEDGFEYILDEDGNVLKDSLGNDVTVPRYATIKAIVFETYQQKAVQVAGQLEIHDIRSRNLLDAKPLAVEAVFENYAASFRGDARALTNESRRFLGNPILPFPTDEQMLFEAAQQLKPLMKEKISHARIII